MPADLNSNRNDVNKVNKSQQNAEIMRQSILNEKVSQNPGMRRLDNSLLSRGNTGLSKTQASQIPNQLTNSSSAMPKKSNVSSGINPNIGMTNRISNARKNIMYKKSGLGNSLIAGGLQTSFLDRVRGLVNVRRPVAGILGFFGREKTEEEQQQDKPTSLEDVTIRIPKPVLIKVLLPVTIGVCIVVLVLAIMTPAMQVYNHVAGDSAIDDATLNEKIEGKDDNFFDGEANEDSGEEATGQAAYQDYEVVPLISSSGLDEVITLENSNIVANFKQYARRYEVEITDITDFFGENYNCESDLETCLNSPEYKFYLKLYDIYQIYRAYGIKLDMSLLMSTIMYKHTDYQDLFEGNLSSYSHENLYDDSGNIIKENTTYMNWETDYKSLNNYTYLNAQDDRYDAQILAKNMVTKTITVRCNGESSTYVDIEDVNYSKYGIDKCSDGSQASISSTYKLDLDKYERFLQEFIYLKYMTAGTEVSDGEVSGGGNVSGQGSLSYSDSYSDGTGTASAGTVFSSEPDPSIALNYWKNYVKSSDFVYPKDSETGLSLGAWPKNYESYPTQLTNFKIYSNEFVWPVTPINGTYTYVYAHNGIDIMAKMGTPIYSPVNGTLRYSEWGHTVNKGSDETAYSVTIKMDNPVTVSGYVVDTVFLTHMCGIRYRCPEGSCSRKVVKGELLGFTGNAAGSAQSVGWAPHLHMTLYNASKGYNSGLITSKIEKLYSISPMTVRGAGE